MNEYPGHTIREKIYESETTEIFRAIQEDVDLPVIIKSMNRKFGKKEFVSRLTHEYTILRQIGSEYVIRAYACRDYWRTPCIILEDFGGESLKRQLAKNTFSLDRLLDMAKKMISGLSAVHDAGIIHKDIHSSNVLINPESDGVKIIDFGISISDSTNGRVDSEQNLIEGNLPYISPEQSGRLNRKLDYRSDYYSFGVLLYELFTGKLPFVSNDPMELVHCHIAKNPVPPNIIDPFLPDSLSRVILKLMAKNPENRYQTSHGIISDLDQCKKELSSGQGFVDFVVGREDTFGNLKFPEKLYGRDRELRKFREILEMANQGKSSVLVVNGRRGIGKTALLSEMGKTTDSWDIEPIFLRCGEHIRDIPYNPLISFLKKKVQAILSGSDQELKKWKAKLLSVLGEKGRVISEIIPEIELIIGPQPPIPVLDPEKNMNRFHLVFQQFILAFSNPEKPSVILVDDYDTADQATMEFISRLPSSSEIRSSVFVFSRRVEDGESTGVVTHIETLKNENIYFEELLIDRMDTDSIRNMTADMFSLSEEKATSLSDILFLKTNGTPFYLTEFITFLFNENVLFFDHRNSEWSWDDALILAQRVTENVADLFSARMKHLSPAASSLLKHAACIGFQFDMFVLEKISRQSGKNLLSALSEILRTSIVVSLEKNPISSTESLKADDKDRMIFQFSHERIRSTILSNMSVDEKKTIHAEIGRVLLLKSNPKEKPDHLFKVLHHLNIASSLLTELPEKRTLLELNLLAGEKAKTSAAFEAAYDYYHHALKLLIDSEWDTNKAFVERLFLGAMESAALCGEFDEMERLWEIIQTHSPSFSGTMRGYEIRTAGLIAQNRMMDAVDNAIGALRLTGIRFPANARKIHVFIEFFLVRLTFRGRRVEELLEMPDIRDEKLLEAIRNIVRSSAAAYFSNSMMAPLMALKSVRILLKYGNAPEAAPVYSGFGLLLCAVMGNYDLGYEFGKLALKLLEREKMTEYRTRTLHIVNNFILHWKVHLAEIPRYSIDAYRTCLETGDFEGGSMGLYQYCFNAFISSMELNRLEADIVKYEKTLEKIKQNRSYIVTRMYHRAILNLLGKTKGSLDLSIGKYDESQLLTKFHELKDRNAICRFYMMKAYMHLILGDMDEAVKYSESAYHFLDGVLGTVCIPLFHFFDILIVLNLKTRGNPNFTRKTRKKTKNVLKKFKKWSDHGPMNHLHRYYLILAEYNRVFGKEDTAGKYYSLAIEKAEENGYIQDGALACELASRFWMETGHEEIGCYYIRKAAYRYKQWGALAKVDQLKELFPQILDQMNDAAILQSNGFGAIPQSTSKLLQSLDLLSIVKATQTISGEIVLSNLIKKMMNIVIENAGAEKGFLILKKMDDLFVEASIVVTETSEIRFSDESILLEECSVVSSGIVHYVIRTGETVILLDAAHEGLFLRDTYVLKNKPLSILCMPILHHGTRIGILYLENNTLRGAFTPSRVEVLKILASQSAISMEIAKLYTNLREQTQKIAEAEKKFRSIFENAVEGMFQVTADGRLLSANQSFAKIFGFESPTELIDSDTPLLNILLLNDNDWKKPLRLLQEHGKVIGYGMEFKKRDGTAFWGTMYVRTVYDGKGNILHFEGSIVDDTERIEKEKAEREKKAAEAVNQKILESIRYAKMIQDSLLPDISYVKSWLPDSFFIWMPRDIVGGDIFFADAFPGGFIIAVIDCTGHGVPGAFMTMIASSSLKQIVREEKCHDPAEILKRLNYTVKTLLKHDKNIPGSDDGMDAAICIVSSRSGEKILTFSGARLPLYVGKDGKLLVFKGDRQSIGYRRSDLDYKYTKHSMAVTKDMSFFLFTDGYPDQMGEDAGKRFGKKRLLSLLENNTETPMVRVGELLIKEFKQHKGFTERLDDVTAIGFRY